MEEIYMKSLRMIKELNIKNKKQYDKIVKKCNLLSANSLKYISQERNFGRIIKIAKEV